MSSGPEGIRRLTSLVASLNRERQLPDIKGIELNVGNPPVRFAVDQIANVILSGRDVIFQLKTPNGRPATATFRPSNLTKGYSLIR